MLTPRSVNFEYTFSFDPRLFCKKNKKKVWLWHLLYIKEIKAGEASIDILIAFRAGITTLFLDSVSLISSDISAKALKQKYLS